MQLQCMRTLIIIDLYNIMSITSVCDSCDKTELGECHNVNHAATVAATTYADAPLFLLLLCT